MNTLIEQVFQWWLVLFFLGIICLPITFSLFSIFFDKGYAFSKTIGIILVSYLVLLLGTTHLVPFTAFSLFAVAGAICIVSIVLLRKTNTFKEIQKNWKIFVFEEILFFLCLLFWSFIKSFQPDIHGLEKFMDFGFINSILRSAYFPPKDMWMAPLSINYYYFGHLSAAVLTRLSFLPSTITFNLMLATLFAATFLGAFSLGGNFFYFFKKIKNQTTSLLKIIFISLLTAFLLTLGGNLHTLYTFFTPYQNDAPVDPTQLLFSPQTFPNQYWYPNATRFIHNTIHEFPSYSFVVSDLHGHVLDIPNVLLMIGLLLLVFMQDPKFNKNTILKTMLLGVLSGIMYMTNAWDGLIYVGAAGLLLFYKQYEQNFIKTLFSKQFLLSFLVLMVSFTIAGMPFSLFFKPFASQIGINCAPAFLVNIKHIGPILFEQGYCQHSPLWQLTILYGFFLFWFISLIVLLFFQEKKKVHLMDTFVIGLGMLGIMLIIVPEFVYLKDIYTTYFRANTMFKLVYQAFILLSLVSGYSIYRIFSSINFRQKNIIWRFSFLLYEVIAVILISLVIIYPYFAVTSYFDNLKKFQGLNGLMYLQNLNKDDYDAVVWINKNIHGQPVLLEAQGDSYTDYERISSNTGLPTVFGWMVHEWLWRGTYDIVPGRIADVKDLYESPSIEQTRQLIHKYNVRYVYIGDMERKKYLSLDEEKFQQLGKVIYNQGAVVIYQLF